MKRTIRVVIVDDHPVFRQGLRQVIDVEPDFSWVGEAADGLEALDMIAKVNPDVAIVDVNLPHLDGLELCRKLSELRLPVHVAILTMYNDEGMFNAAMNLGIKGYLLKDNAVGDIVACVRKVAQGEYYLSPSMSGCLLRRQQHGARLATACAGLDSLTTAERRILKLVALNKTSKEIAKELFISYRTVEAHRANICTKLELRGSHRLLQFAIQNQSAL